MAQATENALPAILPEDAGRALLIGRAWSEAVGGPIPLLIREGVAYDISALAPTISQLFELPDFRERLIRDQGDRLGDTPDVFDPERWHEGRPRLRLLAPVDLQCLKACGVTFLVSVLERVVEELARGDLGAAERIRETLHESLGSRLSHVRPGSAEAVQVKEKLVAEGIWSPYLEVAIGPDAEIFTKAPCLSAVGWGDWIGIREDSSWNNSEPEIVLVCNSRSETVGASLGNDMNLRDFEGRSALLLGKAKDNNASTAIGPFVRVFDGTYSMDDVRTANVALEVKGKDGFHSRDESSMQRISRDPEDLVAQTIGEHHQYPDGLALFAGSLIAPTQDRGEPGKGFTHHPDDVVTVSSPGLGSLVNQVTYASQAPPWRFGIGALMENLARRDLLQRKDSI